jgi:hypothetical protein
MNNCNGKCLNLCDCNCNTEICTCGHREHNRIYIYVRCKCECNIYVEKYNAYIELNCICGHRKHNGNCYLAPSPCCKPIKCVNYEVCKFICLEKSKMPNFPLCIECKPLI